MIRWTILKATLAGICLLIFGQILYIGVLVDIIYHDLLRFMLLFIPVFSAFIASYLAPCRKIVVGISMSIYGAVIGILSAFVYEYFGLHVDHIGGLLSTFVILFAYYVILSIVGSLVGAFLSSKRRISVRLD
jgi:hypothetical protein